jgi:hypothetical protein
VTWCHQYLFHLPFTPLHAIMKYSGLVALSFSLVAFARPTRRAAFTLQNGLDAIALNEKFKNIKAGDSCQAGEDACAGTQFAQCVNGQFVTTQCAAGTICAALPLVNKPGTSIACTTQADVDARIAATGATGTATGTTSAAPSTSAAAPASSPSPLSPQSGGQDQNPPATSSNSTGNPANPQDAGNIDPQTSFTLDPSVVAAGFADDGQDQPTPGQVPSLTSTNNFINFCLTAPGVPITNGKQIKTGSCNPAPMGLIPSTDNMPSAKFVFPTNNGVLNANATFNITLAVSNFDSGNFVNADTNYFAAPQQLSSQGQVVGHAHAVVESISALDQTTPTDPNKFVFFKGLNDKAVDGLLTTAVAGGLPAGTYRLSSIMTAANHQPIVVPVAQRGSLDDVVYFTVNAA